MTAAPEVRTAADVAELRIWLTDQWQPGRPFGDAAAHLHAVRSPTTATAGAYLRHEVAVLQQATLWWVAEDMVDLLLAAAAGIPDDVHLGDLPKMPGAGLVVFAKPWLGIDANDPHRQVQVDALTWGAAVSHLPGRPERLPVCTVSCYRRMDFAAGLDREELVAIGNYGGLAHVKVTPLPPPPPGVRQPEPITEQQHEHGVIATYPSVNVDVPVTEHEAAAVLMADKPDGTVGAFQEDGTTRPGHGTFTKHGGHSYALHGTTWLPLGRSDWPVGDTLGTHPWPAMPAETAASMIEDRKVLAALWHLLHQQGIATTEVRKAPRPTARRTKRAGIEPDLADVRVVVLRKLDRTEAEPGDEHTRKEWSHRWLVSGHWRWQPYGPGRTLRRLTYVRPHVKGPADKPLHVPTTVNAWVR